MKEKLVTQKFNIWVFMVYFLPSPAKWVDVVVQLLSCVQILGVFQSGTVVNKAAIDQFCVWDHMQLMDCNTQAPLSFTIS